MKKLFYSVAAIALIGGPALAAEDAAPAASGTQVDELIVTSRRKEEKVQEVPAAVSSLSADRIKDMGGVRDIKDLSFALPGLAFVDTGNINAENNIRGAGSGTARTAGVDSPIAVLLDGASITGGNAGGRTFVRSDLFDVERVEVTRGPQGALYGVNAVGGVIQAISQRPKNQFGAEVDGAWSPEIRRGELNAIVNVPVERWNLGFRLGVQRAKKDKGFFYNAYTGKYGDVEDYTSIKFGVEWKPVEGLDIYSVFSQSDELSASNGVRSINRLNDPSAAATLGPVDIDGPFVFQHNTTDDVNRNLENFNTQIAWDSPIGKITSTTLLRHRKTAYSTDGDDSAPGYATPPSPAPTCATRSCATIFFDDTEIDSEEIRLANSFGPNIDWIVGANLQGRQTDFATIVTGRTTSATNLNPSATANQSATSREEELQKGLFATVNWRMTDRFEIDAAARYNDSAKKINAYSIIRQPSATLNCSNVYAAPFDVFSLNPACLRAQVLINDGFKNTSPSVSAKYALTPHWRIFATSGIGYRAGGFNANSINDPAIPPNFTPEKNLAYEFGTKFEGGGAYVTITAFKNKFDDMLVTVSSIGPDLVSRNYRFNAGRSETHGFDFEIFGASRFAPGWGVLSYNGAINFLKGEILSGPYAGQKVEGSPEITYTAGLQYRKPVAGDWNFISSLSYRGQRGGFTNTTKINNNIKLPSVNVFNGSVGFSNDTWRVTVDARNLTDETYESLRDPTQSVYADPREVRLTLAYAYGSEQRHRGR